MAQSEAAFQQECVIWFHNTYPNLRGLLFMVNNNSSSKREGAFKKALGLVAGVSDLIFLYECKAHCIELKTPNGYQSTDQLCWEDLVYKQGIDYYVINSIAKFKNLIIKIIEE